MTSRGASVAADQQVAIAIRQAEWRYAQTAARGKEFERRLAAVEELLRRAGYLPGGRP